MKTIIVMSAIMAPIVTWGHNATHTHHETKKILAPLHSAQIKNEIQAIEIANNYLNQANEVGKSHYYDLAEQTIKPWLKGDSHPEKWLVKAKIDQHEHHFEEAIESIKRVLADNPKNNNAHLMATRIYLIKRNFQAAKTHCQQLSSDAYMNIAAICLLEVASHLDQLSASYAVLKSMFMDAELKAPYQTWITLMLSDMATRMNNHDESAYWLARSSHTSDISHLAAWAKNQLQLKQAKVVIERLEPLYQNTPLIEDTLLLQLALAEQQLNQSNKHVSSRTNQLHWKELIKTRIKQREQSTLNHHASEVAQYYLYLDDNPEKAYHWAKINWQQSQEYNDKQLLEATRVAHRSH